MNNIDLSILGAGLSCVDIIKYDVSHEIFLPGGTAANVLSILAKLGLNTTLFSADYRDEFGVWLKESLISQGVNIANFTSSSLPTPRIIEVFSNNGNHTFQTTCPKCGKKLVKSVLPNQSHIKQPILHTIEKLNLFFFDRVSDGIKRVASLNKRGWNFFEPNTCRVYQSFLNAAKFANIIKFADDRVPKSYIDLLLDDLQLSDVKLIIVSSGESGFRFSVRNKTNKLSNWLFVKAAKAERIIDSSGAGDWMTAVFLYRFLQAHPYYVNQLDDEDIYTMLDSAKQVAAFSCGYLGAQGLFKEDQALQQLEEFFGLKLSFSHIPSFTFSGNCQYCKM